MRGNGDTLREKRAGAATIFFFGFVAERRGLKKTCPLFFFYRQTIAFGGGV